MGLADDITTYLKDAFFEKHKPFCFCVDARYRLTDWSGDAGRYGFIDLQRGDDMLQAAPFLLNMLGNETVVIPLMTLPRIGPVEIHIIARAEDHAVLLLGSAEDHAETQVRQQSLNENKLLHVQQQKMIRRQRDLISELVEARSQLERQRQKAQRANEAKGRFIAIMSHEFRTPLSSIISYAERLNESAGDASVAKQCGAAIARASKHLKDLVNSVLDEARLDAGRHSLTLRATDMRSLVDDLAAIIAPLAGEKALSFSAELAANVPSHLELDDGCLRQVLLNLLGNAVKYTDVGRIRFSLDWREQQLIAVVADEGPGIAPADQDRMFQAFERGTEKSSSVKGTGLGLSISLRLVTLMNGTLTMDSDVGKGCRITVSVPGKVLQAPAAGDVLTTPTDTLKAGKPALILICDDDQDMRAIHEYYLTRAGYELLLVGDGKVALDTALERRPDLAILDINTPGMSGIDVARQLRAQGFDAPLVALTASDASRLDPGLFNERLRKPLQMQILLETLKSLLDT
ncbi:MAG: ATP-binding protein [Woeseia sp.]